MSSDEIFNDRKNKFLRIGRNKGFIENIDDLSSLKIKKHNFVEIFKPRKIWILAAGLVSIILILMAIFL
jgi:acetyl-CoA carboxylase carboxyl transferase subunit alpha